MPIVVKVETTELSPLSVSKWHYCWRSSHKYNWIVFTFLGVATTHDTRQNVSLFIIYSKMEP